MTSPPTPEPRGLTLAEVIVVIAIIGIAGAIGFRGLQYFLDRTATRDAVRLAGHLITRARDEALAFHTTVSVRVDTGTASLELLASGLPTSRASLGAVHGVRITTTRDSIAFDARGLGYGAANLTLVARRGSSADTLVVSRLGRVRY